MTEPGSATGDGRIRAFDGTRGLAVAAVLLFHSQFSWARGGFLGVSAFFTLSGFLITSLLLDEHARTGRVSLRAFWIRRGRRLLPAAFLALAGILLFGATVASVDQARALRGDVLSALTYVANWHFYLSGQSYAHLFSAPSPVLHFWSLAIEEQFYLLFPILLFGIVRIARGHRAVLGAFLLAGIAASVTASNLLLTARGESRVYYGTDTRAAELLIGALLAVVLNRSRSARPISTRSRWSATLIGGAALATMLWWWTTVDQRDRWLYRGGFALHACLTAIVIACALMDTPLSRALSWRPLVGLGIISYGVYLFHWPIFLWLTAERTGLAAVPLLGLRVAITLTVAIVSYSLLEQPVLRGRVPLPGAWPKLIAPLAAATLVAGLLIVTWSPPPPQIVLAALGNSRSAVHLATAQPATTTLPRRVNRAGPAPPPAQPLHRPVAGARPLRIMVVGDSVGLTLGRGFELWAREHGIATVDNAGRMYCPLGRGLPAQQGYAEHFDMSPCDWTQRWTTDIASFDPDVVVVLFTIWETAPRRLPGSSKWSTPGDPALDRWQLGEYEAAADTLAARGAQIVWMTAPCEPHFKITPGSPFWRLDRTLIPETAAKRRAVHVLDLAPQLCPHGVPLVDYHGVRNARPDGAHYSDAGALAVAEWAMPIVLGQVPAPPVPRAF